MLFQEIYISRADNPLVMKIRDADSLIRGRERRAHALSMVMTGISAVLPENVVRNSVRRERDTLIIQGREYDLRAFRHIYVAGGGKAAAAMAAELEKVLGDRITAGVVNDRYGVRAATAKIKVNQAGHPLPTKDGLAGVREMLDLLAAAGKEDLVIVLISGGGSALLPYPAPGVSLEDTIRLTDQLLKSGATIAEINCIRKHISGIKGGQLLRYADGATVVSLIVSDVVGDDPGSIASGPTAPDASTYAEALAILEKYRLLDSAPPDIVRHLKAGIEGNAPETLKPGNPAFERVHNAVIASNILALLAAADEARRLGYRPLVLGSQIKGESREVGLVHAGIGKECHSSGNPVPEPAAIISGGETTVTVCGTGRGGRNLEFVLGFLRDYQPGMTVVSVDTDGIDGASDACGAIADETTLPRAESFGLSVQKALENNASFDFFSTLSDLIYTGPTGTNVSDLRIILVYNEQL